MLRPDWFSDPVVSESLLAQDPPAHTRLRSLINKAFTPKVIDGLTEPMVRIAEDLAGRLAMASDVELLTDFSYPFVNEVISQVIGFQSNKQDEIKRWIDLLSYLKPEPPEEPIRQELESIQASFRRYGTEVIADRRVCPRDDLISRVIAAELDGEQLNDRECLAMLLLLITAGFDTTVNLMSNCIRQLAAMPILVDQLYLEPSLIPAFIEEVMRFDPPTHSLLRQTTREVEVAGVTIQRGEFVCLMIGSAGRDSSHYRDPDTFDLHRANKDHLGFGYGIHVCVGMMLARKEVEATLTALVRHFSSIACPTPEELQWTPCLSGRGVVELPVQFIKR